MTRRDAMGLAVVMGVNVAIRLVELSERVITPYFSLSPTLLREPWRLFGPVDIGDGYSRWSTTGLVIVALLQHVISASTVFVLLNLLLVAGAFVLALRSTGSRAFAYALAASMAVTTQYHWSYMNAGVLPLYLMSFFLLWQLAAAAWLVWADSPGAPRRRRLVFVASLLALALSWEQWLDYWLFALAAGVLLLWLAPREPRVRTADVRWGLSVLSTVGLVYIAVKLATATEHGTPGKESELVLGYLTRDGIGALDGAALALEDVVSNFFTYNYLALTNWLPPALLPGRSLDNLSVEALMATQRGYHPAMNHLVGYHHVFYWYLFAGLLTAVLVALAIWAVRGVLRSNDRRYLALALGSLLVLAGSATHLLIKYRPYLSEPLLHYKAGVAVTGVGVLLAMLFATWWHQAPARSRRIGATLGCAVLLWSALTRPASLSRMSERLAMGRLPQPAATVETAVVQAVHRHYTPTKQRILRLIGL